MNPKVNNFLCNLIIIFIKFVTFNMWYDFIKSNNFVDIYIKSLEEFNYRSRSYRLDKIYDN